MSIKERLLGLEMKKELKLDLALLEKYDVIMEDESVEDTITFISGTDKGSPWLADYISNAKDSHTVVIIPETFGGDIDDLFEGLSSYKDTHFVINIINECITISEYAIELLTDLFGSVHVNRYSSDVDYPKFTSRGRFTMMESGTADMDSLVADGDSFKRLLKDKDFIAFNDNEHLLDTVISTNVSLDKYSIKGYTQLIEILNELRPNYKDSHINECIEACESGIQLAVNYIPFNGVATELCYTRNLLDLLEVPEKENEGTGHGLFLIPDTRDSASSAVSMLCNSNYRKAKVDLHKFNENLLNKLIMEYIMEEDIKDKLHIYVFGYVHLNHSTIIRLDDMREVDVHVSYIIDKHSIRNNVSMKELYSYSDALESHCISNSFDMNGHHSNKLSMEEQWKLDDAGSLEDFVETFKHMHMSAYCV